jgi:asparagine synthase (glutamine-hydrolysing)
MMSGLVGYFSPVAGTDLRPLLAKIPPSAANHACLNRIASDGISPPLSEIVFWGNHARALQTQERITASLSASGLAHHRDIEIEICASCLSIRRDLFGRVPFFWTRTGDAVWFASRIDLLLPVVNDRKISLAALYGYLSFSYVPTPETVIEGIASMVAGAESSWQFDGQSLHSDHKRIDDWRESDDIIDSEVSSIRRLRELLEESIACLLPHAGETVGVFLSGGLDSSVAAALLARAGARLRAYTLDFGEYGLPESPYAELVAGALKIPLTKVPATPAQIRRAISATARSLDQPYGDGVTVPLFLLGEAAARDCSIVFNGEGGDQLFAGWANKPIIASGIYTDHSPVPSDFPYWYLRTFHRLHGYETEVFSSAALREIEKIDPLKWIEEALDPTHTKTMLHRLRRANLLLKGAQNIEPRATLLAQAQGLMVRSPFCYKPLAQYTFEVAGELFLRGPCEKYFLKKAVEDLLPADVVWREKRGMGVPLTEWCLGPMRRRVGALLSRSALRAQGLKPELAMRLASGELSGHIRGRRIGENLWLLLMWQAWRKEVLGAKIEQPVLNDFLLPRRLWAWRGEV